MGLIDHAQKAVLAEVNTADALNWAFAGFSRIVPRILILEAHIFNCIYEG